jgi:hypothetical protein
MSSSSSQPLTTIPLFYLSNLELFWRARDDPDQFFDTERVNRLAQILFDLIGFCNGTVLLKNRESLKKVNASYIKRLSEESDRFTLIIEGKIHKAFAKETSRRSLHDSLDSSTLTSQCLKFHFRAYPMPVPLLLLLRQKGTLSNLTEFRETLQSWEGEERLATRCLIDCLDNGIEGDFTSTSSKEHFIQFLFSKAAVCFQKGKGDSHTIYRNWNEQISQWISHATQRQVERVNRLLETLTLPFKYSFDASAAGGPAVTFYDYLLSKSVEKLEKSTGLLFPEFIRSFLIVLFRENEPLRKQVLLTAALSGKELAKDAGWPIIVKLVNHTHLRRFIALNQRLPHHPKLASALYTVPLTDKEWSDLKGLLPGNLPAERLDQVYQLTRDIVGYFNKRKLNNFYLLYSTLIHLSDFQLLGPLLNTFLESNLIKRAGGIDLEEEFLPLLQVNDSPEEVKATITQLLFLQNEHNDRSLFGSLPTIFWTAFLFAAGDFSKRCANMSQALKDPICLAEIEKWNAEMDRGTKGKWVTGTFFKLLANYIDGQLQFHHLQDLMKINILLANLDSALQIDLQLLNGILSDDDSDQRTYSPSSPEVMNPLLELIPSEEEEPLISYFMDEEDEKKIPEENSLSRGRLRDDRPQCNSSSLPQILDLLHLLLKKGEVEMKTYIQNIFPFEKHYHLKPARLLCLLIDSLPHHVGESSTPGIIQSSIKESAFGLLVHFNILSKFSKMLNFFVPEDFVYSWCKLGMKHEEPHDRIIGLEMTLKSFDEWLFSNRHNLGIMQYSSLGECCQEFHKKLLNLSHSFSPLLPEPLKYHRGVVDLLLEKLAYPCLPPSLYQPAVFFKKAFLKPSESGGVLQMPALVSNGADPGVSLFCDWELPSNQTQPPVFVFSLVNLATEEAFVSRLSLPWSYQHLIGESITFELLESVLEQKVSNPKLNIDSLRGYPEELISLIKILERHYYFGVRWLGQNEKQGKKYTLSTKEIEHASLQDTLFDQSHSFITIDTADQPIRCRKASLETHPGFPPMTDHLLDEIISYVRDQTPIKRTFMLNRQQRSLFDHFLNEEANWLNNDLHFTLRIELGTQIITFSYEGFDQTVHYNQPIHQEYFRTMLQWQLRMLFLKIYVQTDRILRF